MGPVLFRVQRGRYIKEYDFCAYICIVAPCVQKTGVKDPFSGREEFHAKEGSQEPVKSVLRGYDVTCVNAVVTEPAANQTGASRSAAYST